MKPSSTTRRGGVPRVPLAVLLALGGAAAWFRGPVHAGATTGPAPGVAAAPSPNLTAGRPRCALTPGRRFALDVRGETHLEVDLAGLLAQAGQARPEASGGVLPVTLTATPPQTHHTTHAFRLELEAVELRPDGSQVLAAQLHDLVTSIETQGGGGSKPATIRPEEVAAPFLIRIDGDCGVMEYAWRARSERAQARAQQALVAELSFSAPRGGPGRFEREGFDVHGRHRARYLTNADGSVLGRVLSYSQVFGGGQSRVLRSGLRVRPGDDTWIDSLSNDRSLQLLAHGVAIGELSLETRATAVPPSAWRAHLDPRDTGWVWGLLLPESREARNDLPAPEGAARTGEVSLSDALATTRALLAGGGQSVADVVVQLRDWLRAHPGALGKLLGLIRAGGFDDEPALAAALFAALGDANTPETRAALMEILTSDEFGFRWRRDASQALVQAEPLPPGFPEALLAEARRWPAGSEERGHMALTAGMLVSAQGEGRARAQGDEVAAVRDEIRGWLRDTQGDLSSTMHALQSAGNAGDDSLLPEVVPYLADGDARVRVQAADALRQMSPAARAALEQHYFSEQVPAVRGALLRAANDIDRRAGSSPSPRLIEALAARLGATTDRGESAAVIASLGAAADAGDPEANAALGAALAAELARPTPNPERAKQLGRYVNSRWRTQQ